MASSNGRPNIGQKIRRNQEIQTAYYVPVKLWSDNPDLLTWDTRAKCEHVFIEHYQAQPVSWRLDLFEAGEPLDDRGNKLPYAVVRVTCIGFRVVQEKVKTPLLGINGRPI